MQRRAVPLVLLILSLVSLVVFSQGLRLIDTIGMLASGVVAGASIAALASRRRK